MTYLKRNIDNVLAEWKKKDITQRWPLLIRGARQVGKSYTLTEFGEKEFEHLVKINFEQHPQYKACFDTLDPNQIIEYISLLQKTVVKPGKTLLFLDEIQECPKAITALRYFYEQMPELHVIGAGSLLEFALEEKNFKMPVGRVQYLYMKPFSFREFLQAVGENIALEKIDAIHRDKILNTVIHQHLLSLVKKYSLVGGMPRAVAEYVSSGSLAHCHQVHTIIIQTSGMISGNSPVKLNTNISGRYFIQFPKW